MVTVACGCDVLKITIFFTFPNDFSRSNPVRVRMVTPTRHHCILALENGEWILSFLLLVDLG